MNEEDKKLADEIVQRTLDVKKTCFGMWFKNGCACPLGNMLPDPQKYESDIENRLAKKIGRDTSWIAAFTEHIDDYSAMENFELDELDYDELDDESSPYISGKHTALYVIKSLKKKGMKLDTNGIGTLE